MLKIVETGNKYGTMNTGTMPKDLSKEEKAALFMEHRMAAGEDYGFDGHKMFMADQKDKTGTYFKLTNEYVEANPNGWTDIDQDILIITEDVPGVVIGHPVADCPVIMMQDVKNRVCAIGHCSAELIDKKMPMMIADALLDAYDSKDEDIVTYVSACASTSWTYDSFPKWATDGKIWNNAIFEEKDGIFRIDLKRAIRKELAERNIAGRVTFSSDDTITNPHYYSNSAAAHGDQAKYGRNFAGAFYKEKTLSR